MVSFRSLVAGVALVMAPVVSAITVEQSAAAPPPAHLQQAGEQSEKCQLTVSPNTK